MGNLNQFYFMGRLAKAPDITEQEGEGKVAHLAVAPGTSGRRGRGLSFTAYGPQAEIAQSLRVGQALVLRGQLRQEGEGAGALVARVQAIQVLADDQPRPGGGSSEGGGERSTKRRRRRGGRGRRPEGGEAPAEGAEGASAPAEGGGEGGESPSAPPAPPRPEPKPLPPPTPVAKPNDSAPPPAGDVKADMPF